MKLTNLSVLFVLALLIQCNSPVTNTYEFTSISSVDKGIPTNVMLTSYSTTLIANGEDETRLRIAVIDSAGREITSATNTIQVYLTGEGNIVANDGNDIQIKQDTLGSDYFDCKLVDGICNLKFTVGKTPGKVKIEIKSENLWPASHELHTLPDDFVYMKPSGDQLPPTTKTIDNMIGADISWLPQLEDEGRVFTDNGLAKDGIILIRDHGFNYIRLRIFVNPENENGYSPNKGYCGLDQTLEMAKRVKDAGMKILLDFHYSDYWADPQKQYKPQAWANLDFETLTDSVKTYTENVILALKNQGTMPDMVQIGNEINHGMIWPDGHISNPDGLAKLLKAGVKGVVNIDPNVPIMMHIALGGLNDESVFWLDNMIARGVKFDIIGISYYPRWHGTLDNLKDNLNDLVARYNKPINVVEYSWYKREVHDIVFNLPNGMGKGAAIWEPYNWGSRVVNNGGMTISDITIYDELNGQYIKDK